MMKPIVQEIEVVEKLMSQKNLFADANWDDGLTQWETDSSKDGVNVQLYPEFEDPFPAPPVNAVRVEGVKNFTFRISQKKKNLAPGRYVLKAQYAGTDTTGVEVHLFAEKTNDVNTQNSELFQAVIHPTKEWQEAKIQLKKDIHSQQDLRSAHRQSTVWLEDFCCTRKKSQTARKLLHK